MNLDSLCAKVLKAKYLPNESLLQATPKNGSSFTWQSIMKGLGTFKLGYIWNNPWVPSSSDMKVVSARGHTTVTRVCELIDLVTGTWDAELLQVIFILVDVCRIIQIPINLQGFEDIIVWNLERRGLFTVHSAYHTQCIRKYKAHAITTSTIWKLQIPCKVQFFCWRILHKTIPLKAILTNRHIGSNGACPIFHQAAEDIPEEGTLTESFCCVYPS
jgi:hypothetical protein